jgi:hypothetical protein
MYQIDQLFVATLGNILDIWSSIAVFPKISYTKHITRSEARAAVASIILLAKHQRRHMVSTAS